MKRTSVILALVVSVVAFVATSCGTAAPAAAPAADPVSDFIREVRRGSPENAILGIGASNHSNRSLARTAAETRARAEVARQVDVMVRNMVLDYTAGSEAEQQALLQFTETVTQTLAQQAQRGAVIRDEINIGGEQVTVVMFTGEAFGSGLMDAHQAAAALAPHANHAMWAAERMNRALTEQATADPVIRNHD